MPVFYRPNPAQGAAGVIQISNGAGLNAAAGLGKATTIQVGDAIATFNAYVQGDLLAGTPNYVGVHTDPNGGAFVGISEDNGVAGTAIGFGGGGSLGGTGAGTAYGGFGAAYYTNAGANTGFMAGLLGNVNITNGGTMAEAAQIWAPAPFFSAGGTLTKFSGVLIDDQAVAGVTTPYQVFSKGTTALAYYAGPLQASTVRLGTGGPGVGFLLSNDGTNVLVGAPLKVASGSAFTLGNAATTGLGAGLLAALTNASIVIKDSMGQAYRIPCII